MDSLQFVIITHSEISTQKTLIFKKISVFICRKLVFLCLLFWSAYLGRSFHLELVHCLACFRHIDRIAVAVRHILASPSLLSGNILWSSVNRSFTHKHALMSANSRYKFQQNCIVHNSFVSCSQFRHDCPLSYESGNPVFLSFFSLSF